MNDRGTLLVAIASAVSFMFLSIMLHSNLASPNIYSDIASFWGRSWLVTGQVPYSSVGAFFEYPPVSGILLYISRIAGGAIAGVAGGNYAGYYLAFSALSLAGAAALAWSTWRLARALGVKANPIYFALPSMIVYGLYNFDLFNALFIVLSLQFYVEKRRDYSAVFLGVALATKFVAGVMLPIFLMDLGTWKDRGRYTAISLIVGGAFFVPIAIYNFGFFSQFISFYQHWGLEDAWYLWIFRDPFSGAAKLFGLFLGALLLAWVYLLRMPLVQKCFLALSAYLLSTYIYAPQFNLTLLPLVIVLGVTSPFLYSWEVFNALIILTWFTFPNPTLAGTLPQTMALLRTASLALLCLSIGASNGYSILDWLKARAGLGHSMKETAPVGEPNL